MHWIVVYANRWHDFIYIACFCYLAAAQIYSIRTRRKKAENQTLSKSTLVLNLCVVVLMSVLLGIRLASSSPA